jgi:hypothetical protein
MKQTYMKTPSSIIYSYRSIALMALVFFTTPLWSQLSVVVAASDTMGCGPVCLDFISNQQDTANSYHWDFGDGTPAQSTVSVRHCFLASGTYTITLEVNKGAQKGKGSTHVHILLPPEADFYIANPTGHTYQFTDVSAGAVSYTWYFGDSLNSYSTAQNPSFSYPSSGLFLVELVVKNSYGCQDTMIHEVNLNTGIAHSGGQPVQPLLVYPNPSSNGHFAFKLDSENAAPSVVEITDAMNRIVLRKEMTGQYGEIDLGTEPGLYFITIQNEQGIRRGKLLVGR